MISFLKKIRLPYREDDAFSLLAFCVFLVPLAFSFYSFENFETIKFSLFLIFTGVSGLVFFLKRKEVKVNRYLKLIFLSFGLWLLISVFLSRDYVYGFFGFYYRYTSGFIFYGTLALFTFLLINLLNSGRFEYLLKILIIDALAVSLISFLQSFGWVFYAGPEAGGIFRGPSLLGNSNYSAMFLAVILPFAIYFFIQSKALKQKVYYSVACFFTILGTLLLSSRGAILGIVSAIVCALFFIALFKFEKKYFVGLAISTLVVLVAGGFLLNVVRPQAVSGIFNNTDTNSATRFYAWKVSVIGIMQKPLFGYGPGNYALFFERNRTADMAGEIGVFDDAHNLFLHLAVTGGLPFGLGFFGLIGWSVVLSLKKFKKTGDFLSLAIASSLLAWAVSSCFNPVSVPMYILLAVLITGTVYESLPQINLPQVKWEKYNLSVVAAFIAVWGLNTLVTEHLLGFSRDAYLQGNYVRSYKLASWASFINPTNSLFFNFKTASAIQLGLSNEEIEKGINNIVSLHPDQSGSYVNASNLYNLMYFKNENSQDLNMAISEMQKAIGIDPLFSERYGQLALFYYKIGDYSSSKENALKGLAIDGKIFASWILLAKLYQLNGQKEPVIFALNQAFKLNPNIPQLKYLLFLARHVKDIKQVPIDILAKQPVI